MNSTFIATSQGRTSQTQKNSLEEFPKKCIYSSLEAKGKRCTQWEKSSGISSSNCHSYGKNQNVLFYAVFPKDIYGSEDFFPLSPLSWLSIFSLAICYWPGNFCRWNSCTSGMWSWHFWTNPTVLAVKNVFVLQKKWLCICRGGEDYLSCGWGEHRRVMLGCMFADVAHRVLG